MNRVYVDEFPSRPPGHHAMEDAANGYCVFNNVAIATRRALNQHNIDRCVQLVFVQNLHVHAIRIYDKNAFKQSFDCRL